MSKIARPAKSEPSSVLWRILWIAASIGSFFVASAFWTPFIAKHFGSIHETHTSIIWAAAVFGTFLVPLIIVIYSKGRKAYEDAHLSREKNAMRFKSISIEKKKRELKKDFSSRLAAWPQIIKGGHLISVKLKNGREIPYIFVAEGKEILGIYEHSEYDFQAGDIAEIYLVDTAKLPSFQASSWLRLDGISQPE